jgi:hypothetical protein
MPENCKNMYQKLSTDTCLHINNVQLHNLEILPLNINIKNKVMAFFQSESCFENCTTILGQFNNAFHVSKVLHRSVRDKETEAAFRETGHLKHCQSYVKW